MKIIDELLAMLGIAITEEEQQSRWVREWEYDPNGASDVGMREYTHDRRHFRLFGALLWTRAFGLGDAIAFFPTAIAFARANRTR